MLLYGKKSLTLISFFRNINDLYMTLRNCDISFFRFLHYIVFINTNMSHRYCVKIFLSCGDVLTKRCCVMSSGLQTIFVTANRKQLYVGSHFCVNRFCTTALHISGDKAQSQPFIVQPDLDFDHIFKNFDKTRENLKARCLDVDLSLLQQEWKILKEKQALKKKLEEEKMEIAGQIGKQLQSKSSSTMEHLDIDELKKRGKDIREQIKDVSKQLYQLEDAVIPALLKLPNELHPQTPLREFQKLMDVGKKPIFEFKPKKHVAIGAVTDTISFATAGPKAYYLQGMAAELEVALVDYFIDEIISHNFIPLSSPDMFSSAIVEGCGLDWTDPSEILSIDAGNEANSKKTLQLKTHLVGVSVLPFSALHTRMVVAQSALPLRYFTVGRCYNASITDVYEQSLLDTVQATTMDIFGATMDDTKSDQLFSEFSRILASLYSALALPCQTVLVPGSHLGQAEKLRVELQVYLPGYNKYVEVANISLYGEFVSKRLMMRWAEDPLTKDHKYLNVVHGTVLNVPYLTACIMENYQKSDGTFTVPEVVKKFLPD